MHRPQPDRSRRWYDANARRYDRLHPGLPGDIAFYAELARDAEVLEIGAGTGRVTEALAGVARRVIALDRAPAMLALARRRLHGRANVDLLIANAASLPLGRAFDLVVLAYRVVQHLSTPDRESLWLDLSALVRPGGAVAFDTWHGPHGLVHSADVALTPATPDTIRRELAEAGYAIRVSRWGFPPGEEIADTFNHVWLAAVRRCPD